MACTRVPSWPKFDALQLRPGPPTSSRPVRCARAPSSATTLLARPHSTCTHASPHNTSPNLLKPHVLATQCASTRTSTAGPA
ncbi:hypothetical protein FIBSPDRAFT_519171 [Athelia psychrophila]|uniref:Uncharacterized protein n=1 Tax=Athelia psychrophila TaxID=1759441 RepID=A0A166JRE9_9AGAM|nr:hypothetical protein FIBSPDRAFT_519171 [Fibularhizoctonia sp. CBS 109695]